MKIMQKTVAHVALATLAFVSLSGCSSGPQAPPAQAVVHPPGTRTADQASKVWTKADKIAVVNKAPITEDQKKAEIAKIQA